MKPTAAIKALEHQVQDIEISIHFQEAQRRAGQERLDAANEQITRLLDEMNELQNALRFLEGL